MTKETAFHSRWSELTRNVTEYRGYWLPTCFTNQGAVQEYWACREKAVVMDLSPLRKWEVLGPGRRGAHPGDDHARRHAGWRTARSSTPPSATRPAA